MKKDSSIFPEFFIGDESLVSLSGWINVNAQSNRIFIITDENAEKYCLPEFTSVIDDRYEIHFFSIKPGEQSKTIGTCIELWQEMTDAVVTKKDLIVNLGGGVISDLGGFVASAFKRGVQFINVPTSLMGMIDASIGGKNGVDLNHIKNVIGTFDTPSAIAIHPAFLKTLPERELKNGLAEIYKHGLIADNALWNQLPSTFQNTEIDQFIAPAIKVKTTIVKEDPFESGKRKILNFGHTIGHAIESWFLKNKNADLLHGEAVVAGMIMETFLSENFSGLSKSSSDEIIQKLISVFGKPDLSAVDLSEIISFLYQDKKNENGELRFSLLKSIGEAEWDIAVPEEEIEKVFSLYSNLNAS